MAPSVVRADTGDGGVPGHGSSLETDRDFNWSRLEKVKDGFFVKLAYRVRW